MKALKKTLVIGTSSIMALSGMGGVALAATQADVDQPTASAEEQNQQSAESNVVQVSQVIGEFAFTQGETTANDVIKKNLGDASKYLCGAHAVADAEEPVEDWTISVSGAVSNPYEATYDEFVQSDGVQSLLLGCACAGNPADGRAAANAEVTGVSALVMIGMAEPSAEANTVVFTSADGYEVALPLDYIQMHYCPIVFDVNGAPLAESMGGTNQLWLGSTAASYFARDIVSITLEERQTPPPSPNSDEARAGYGNLPNIGVMFGGDVQ